MPDDYKVEYEGKATATVRTGQHPSVGFFGANGGAIVSINTETGDVTFGEGYTASQASTHFWELVKMAIRRQYDCSNEVSHPILLAAGHDFCWKCGRNLEAKI